ncbi:hypothetical protein ACR3K2_30840 [Cryptosporidium serpentis]
MTSNPGEILNLKVMALSLPSTDMQISTLSLLPNYPEYIPDDDICVDNMYSLLLPTVQCRLYCGESFHAFLSISNISLTRANNVILKTEIISVNSRNILYSNEDNLRDIEIGNSINTIIKERVDEVGLFNLTCQIYFIVNGSKLTQKRSYKFAVIAPFNISHRLFYHNDDLKKSKLCFIEVSLENITHQSISLEKLDIQNWIDEKGNKQNIQVSQLSTAQFYDENCKNTSQLLCNSGIIVLRPRSRYNQIFCITQSLYKEFINNFDKYITGQLSIFWKSKTYGDAFMSSYSITCQISNEDIYNLNGVAIDVIVPSTIEIQTIFTIEVVIINDTDKELYDIELSIDNEALLPFCILGMDILQIKFIEPNQKITIPLQCISFISGVHSINGIKLINSSGEEICKLYGNKEILVT